MSSEKVNYSYDFWFNNQDPQFYAFYRSMQAYKSAFASKNDILVLKPDSQFFEYFNKTNGSKIKSIDDKK